MATTGYQLPEVTEAGEFELVPPGMYRFRLADMEDAGLGMSFNGEKPKPRTKWVFEIVEVISGDEEADDFVGKEFWAWTSTNMNVRSTMYKWVAALLGDDLDIGSTPSTSDLIGKTMRATIVHYAIEKGERKGEIRHKIDSVMKDASRRRKAAPPPPPDPEGFDDEEDEF